MLDERAQHASDTCETHSLRELRHGLNTRTRVSSTLPIREQPYVSSYRGSSASGRTSWSTVKKRQRIAEYSRQQTGGLQEGTWCQPPRQPDTRVDTPIFQREARTIYYVGIPTVNLAVY